MNFVRLFLVAWLMAAAFRLLASAVPGLSQLFLALAALKWAAFVMLTYVTFARADSKKGIWLLIFLAEFVASIGGYFSTFKDVFIYALLGIAASQLRIGPRRMLLMGCFVVVLLWFGLIWTAIKPDYRQFLSGGAASQTVTVSMEAAMAKAIQLALELDGQQVDHAIDHLFRRIMYTEYFGATISYVPSVVPFEAGALWFDAISRPLMPRFLFPDKAAIDDSLLTNKYTGLGVAGLEQGTSISLGYMTEAYIDFGPFFMLFAILLLGAVFGRLYRWLMYNSGTMGLIGFAMAPVFLMPIAAFEIAAAKLVGGLFAQVLAGWIVIRYLIPWFLPWLLVRR